MTDFDIDLSGVADLQGRLEELEQRGSTDAVYVTGTTVTYGIYLEMGTEDMPPYPWFRPAIREFRANPEGFITENTGYATIDDIPTAGDLVNAVALALESQFKNNVSAGRAADRSPGTHPEHPQRDTSTLVNSIQAVRVR